VIRGYSALHRRPSIVAMSACIHSILRADVHERLPQESCEDAERALAEILENHRAAGRAVYEGLHDGRPAWHVITSSGGRYAVFWIVEADDLAW
jgi:hypothetical protein